MDNIKFEKYEIKGIPIFIYRTSRFSRIIFNMVFLNEFKKEEITLYNVLLAVLASTTKKYNTKKKKTIALDDLYSARIAFSDNSLYKQRITSVSLEMIDESYIDNKENRDYLKEGIYLLKEFLFNPNLKNKAFNKKEVDEKRFELFQYLKSLNDDKNYVAMNKLFDIMAKDEVISYHNLGYLEDLDKMDEKDVYHIYEDLMNNSEKAIFIVGDFDIDKYHDVLSDFIPSTLPNPKCRYPFRNEEGKVATIINEVKEEDDIVQAKLHIGLRTKIGDNINEIYHLNLFNMMFGELYNSSLMHTIREEKALAYSIYSVNYLEDQIIYIDSEINKDKYEEVVKLIKNILDDYKKGNIDQELLELAKMKMKNGSLALYDSPMSILRVFSSNYIRRNEEMLEGFEQNIARKVEIYEKTTVEDIKNVSQKISIDTIYLLYNKE